MSAAMVRPRGRELHCGCDVWRWREAVVFVGNKRCDVEDFLALRSCSPFHGDGATRVNHGLRVGSSDQINGTEKTGCACTKLCRPCHFQLETGG